MFVESAPLVGLALGGMTPHDLSAVRLAAKSRREVLGASKLDT